MYSLFVGLDCDDAAAFVRASTAEKESQATANEVQKSIDPETNTITLKIPVPAGVKVEESEEHSFGYLV
jgi:hypothetical protein